MANRFPITLNPSTNRLEELPSADNINLSNNGIYDGASSGTNGQVLTSTGSGGVSWSTIEVSEAGAQSLNELTDVTITSASNGQVLKFDGSKWINGTDNSGGSVSLSGLSDVSITSINTGQLLRYNATANKWENWAPTYLTSTGSINTHTDVTIASVSANQILRYNGTTWENWTPNYLTTYAETDTLSTVTARGASTDKEVTFKDVNITGTLNVSGTTATTNTTTLNVTNTKIVLNSGQQSASLSAFLEVDRGLNNADVSIRWNEVDDKWQFTNNGTTFYDIPSGSEYLTSTGSINTHTDVTITSPQSGQVLKYDGTKWVNDTDQTGSGSGGGSTVFVQETDPTDPVIGNLWWKPTIDSLKIYENTDTWTSIETGGIKFIQDTTPSVEDSTEGDLWFDFSMPGIFVYTKVDQESITPTYVWVQV
jgi:hypothetical protein